MKHKKYAFSALLLCSYFQVSKAFLKKDAINNNISVTVSNTFTVELTENPSTGFTWQFSKQIDPQYLQLIEDNYIQGKKNMPGAPGKAVWKFKALKPGTTTFELKYIRPWEKSTVKKMPTSVQKYTVKIDNK